MCNYRARSQDESRHYISNKQKQLLCHTVSVSNYQTVQICLISALPGVFSAFRQIVPATVIKQFHDEGREEASLCPPASPSNDRPHGNAGLISGWILEGSQGVCVCVYCMCQTSPIDNGTIDGEIISRWIKCELVEMTISESLWAHTFSQCTISQAPFLSTVARNETDRGSDSEREEEVKETKNKTDWFLVRLQTCLLAMKSGFLVKATTQSC